MENFKNINPVKVDKTNYKSGKGSCPTGFRVGRAVLSCDD
jgi:hypothetical protein